MAILNLMNVQTLFGGTETQWCAATDISIKSRGEIKIPSWLQLGIVLVWGLVDIYNLAKLC